MSNTSQFFEDMYEARNKINAAIIGDRYRIDFKEVVPNGEGAPGHYYYGSVIGFRAASFHMDMVAHHDFTPRKQYISYKCVSPINRLEELLYF